MEAFGLWTGGIRNTVSVRTSAAECLAGLERDLFHKVSGVERREDRWMYHP